VKPDPIRILLVEDHKSFRELLSLLLEKQDDMVVAGEAATLSEARAILSTGVQINMALIDLELPDGHGSEMLPDLRRRYPDAQAIVLTGNSDVTGHARAVAAGAGGLIDKAAPIGEILDAMRRIREGKQLLSRDDVAELRALAATEVMSDLVMADTLASLSTRDRQLLQAVAEGLSDKEIAERLSLSPKTVRNQMTTLLAKLGVDSRTQALLVAIKHKVVRL
jgi:DNA-binding NarL/FixJ family response regulator